MGCGGGQARAPHACLHALRAPGCCRTRPSRSPIHPTNLQPPQRSLPTINTTPLRLPQLAYVTPIVVLGVRDGAAAVRGVVAGEARVVVVVDDANDLRVIVIE